jgi:hypothetical protein
MSPLAKKAERAQVGHNTKRSLDAIATDIHRIERANIFAIGELLTEADDACSHGEWLPWLEANFTWWSHDTALRYMAAYKLSAKYARVRNLLVPSTIIYELGEDIDAPDLPTIIEALGKASKSAKTSLSVADCNHVIGLAKAWFTWGDLPGATLLALEDIQDHEWAAGAIEQLKTAQPDTNEAADKIVLAHHRKHLEGLFGGTLPDWLDRAMLNELDGVDPKCGKQLLAKLQAAAQPLDGHQVIGLAYSIEQEKWKVEASAKARHLVVERSDLPEQQVVLHIASSPYPNRSDDLCPDTSEPSGEVPAGLKEIAAQASEISEPSVQVDRYEILLAAWQAAGEAERRQFLRHIGARLTAEAS